MAETIAKINKTEEFTRRQDYIKQVSEILRIEEDGLNALVNKFIRDKISKDESRNFKTSLPDDLPSMPSEEEVENVSLFNRDELQEQAMVRSLLEFGLKEWDDKQTVATYIFSHIDEAELDTLIDNQLLVRIIHLYREWYKEGIQPNAKSFLYHEDAEMNKMVIKIMETDTDISPNWKDHYEGHIATREDLYREEVFSTLNYLQLRKIKRLIAENQSELERSADPEEQLFLMQTHQHLKQLEIELTRLLGTVIYK
ncbi:MAG: hypothetical protein V9E88_16160 [Ferruginibacter sp.]